MQYNRVMLFSKLTQKPMLAIGILFMVIFLSTTGGKILKRFMPSYGDRLNPTSCRALLVKLNRRVPANWVAACNKNNLNVEVLYKFPKIEKETLENVRAISYRELANAYVFIAKNSPSDNLERTDIVSVRFDSEYLKINSISEGKFVVKLATLTRKELIQQHFHSTVQVQEVKKDKTPKN